MHISIQSLAQLKEQIHNGELIGVTRLEISCGLTEFPEEIFSLADSLEILDLSGNALSSLPDQLPALYKLKILFCSFNQFVALPEVLGQCKALSMVGFRNNQIAVVSGQSLPPLLRWLILTSNQVETLPAEIGHRPLLQKLMVAGNHLKALPDEIGACKNLELIRIAANSFEAFPEVLLTLPRLSWLSYSGNPFCAAHEQLALQNTPVQKIEWDMLALQQKLGEGASGVIYQADMHEVIKTDSATPSDPSNSTATLALANKAAFQKNPTPVAVKLFKGALTSDGLPVSEMAACMRAGQHENLIEVLGKINSHPEAVNGLVMSLVGPSYRNLAGPPSFESCTRDVYDVDLRLSPDEVLRIAHGMAGVANQLHLNGIMHGDFYGHNILLDGQGHALLGDFGAACFKPVDARQSQALERIEVRAFGCLLEELLERCDGVDPSADESLGALYALRDACLSDEKLSRPLFKDMFFTKS